MADLPQGLREEMERALRQLTYKSANWCYHCGSNDVVMLAQEILVGGVVKDYAFRVACGTCKYRGPESNRLGEAVDLWVAMHRIIHGRVRRRRQPLKK